MRRPLLVLAAAAALMTAMGSASADPPIPPASEPGAEVRKAEPGPLAPGLSAASPTDDVIAPVAEHIFELGTGRGFVSLRTDYDARAIAALWQGEVPADVLAYAESQPYGVAVTVKTGARYNREEGNAARARILADPLAVEIGVVSASVNHDGSGVTLGVMADEVTGEQRDRLARLSGLAAGEITINAGRREPLHYSWAITPEP